jgi:peptidyl-prolyl cis-trans isomerase B (cyclophilin B)
MIVLISILSLTAGLVIPKETANPQEASAPIPAAVTPQLADNAKLAKDGYIVRIDAPDLALEGEPWRVTIEVIVGSERAIELPLWALTSAALELDARPPGERIQGVLSLAPQQRVSTTLDLSALLAQRAPDDPSAFSIRHGLGGEPRSIQWLRRAEKGIDFMTLPVEQLADYQVVLTTTAGFMWLELWPDVAPNHTRNFLDLAYTGFYDGSKFYRVIPGFMIQGGRGGDGRPAPRKVKQEFSTRRHVAGVLSAARLGNDVDSATSEFFIMHKPTPHLDGQYTAYGALVAAYPRGLEALESVVGAVDANNKLVNELKRAAPIDVNHPYVQAAVNNPNPPQSIVKATVVKAPRKR